MRFYLAPHLPRLVGWGQRTTESDKQTGRNYIDLYMTVSLVPLLVIDIPILYKCASNYINLTMKRFHFHLFVLSYGGERHRCFKSGNILKKLRVATCTSNL